MIYYNTNYVKIKAIFKYQLKGEIIMAKKYVETRSAIVTGAGTGLGFATAKMLKEQGWKVYGTIGTASILTSLPKALK